MKTYIVRIPVSGVLEVEVEAANVEEAIIEAQAEDVNCFVEQLVEWEAHEAIVQGNVFYGLLNEIEVVEL